MFLSTALPFFLKTFSYKFANFSHSKEEEEVSHTMGKNNREAKEKKGQPEPLSGSHKVKNRNHSRQKHHAHHDM